MSFRSILPAFVLATVPFLATPAPAQDAPGLHLSSQGDRFELRLEDGTLIQTSEHPIENARQIEVAGSAIQLVLWEELLPGSIRRAHYRIGRGALGFTRVRETSYELKLVRQDFDPLRSAPDFADSPVSAGGKLHIVQFVTQPLPEFRAAIEALGGKVYNFLAQHAHIVLMEEATREQVAALPWVRWVGPYHAEYRLEPFLLEGLRSTSLAAPLRYNIQVFERGPGQKGVVADKIRAFGGRIEAVIPQGFLLEATLTPDQLVRVAAWDEVLWIDRWSPPEEDMNLVRIDGGADYVEAQTAYTGQGVRGEVMDGNVLITHQAFQATPILLHGTRAGDESHGTSTTGIVFADGTGNASGRGMLPLGQPIFADYGQLVNRYTHTAQLLQSPYFAVFQSNSWGSSLTSQYNSISSEMDDILFDNDIVICQSQSNNGDVQSRPQAWAKNIVACGGIRHRNTLGVGDDAWTGGASIGPAADGRIKPDLCYWYDSILTTSSSGGYTTGFGGTSASTPEVAGHFGLFFQMWHENVFATDPGGGTVFDSRPKATTARAMMINSAAQYSFSGANHDLTRTHQGWGRPSLTTLYDERDRFFIVDESEALEQFESIAYPMTVPENEPVLMVTLVYLDPPGTTSSSQHRINDLSLKLTSPGGVVNYWGNNGLHTGNWSVTGGVSNTLDVVENIYVQSPAAGVWTVEVFADEINQDGHVETPELDADFALVVRGTDGLGGDPCFSPTKYCVSAANSVTPAGADLTVGGTTSVAANDFTLLTSRLPANKAGIYYYGVNSANVPFGNGVRCVGGQIFRLPVTVSNAFGEASWALDITNPPQPAGQITAGSTWFFQFWYRDPAGGGAGFNLSDAVEASFCD
jgi:hypothetical protein